MKAAYRKAFPTASEASVRASYGQVFRFAHEMEAGDPVVYPIKSSRDILVGEIAGPYRSAEDDPELVESDYCNIRKVKWIKSVPRIGFSQDALHSFGGFSSVATSNDYLEDVMAGLKGDKAAPPSPAKQDGAPIAADVEQTAAEAKMNLAERTVEETHDYLLRQWSRTSQQFEHVVAALFRAIGYTAHVQQGTHDLGVDVITSDLLSPSERRAGRWRPAARLMGTREVRCLDS